MTVKLAQTQPFARGSKRACYAHPSDANKCIKVLLPEADERAVKRATKWYKRVYPDAHFNENTKDIKGYALMQKSGAPLEAHFPAMFGVVKTDVGDGLVVELIRDSNGKVSNDVAHAMQGAVDAELTAAVQEFYQFLLQHALVLRDLHTKNLLLQRADEGVRIVMIEGFGNSDFIPLAQYSKWFARKKIRRKMKRAFPNINFAQ